MFVEIVKRQDDSNDGGLDVLVFGEKLTCDEHGHFLIPGQFVTGLKPADLPAGVGFRLLDQLRSGAGFYKEDCVVLRYHPEGQAIQVQVTTTYAAQEWDGLFNLQATIEARRLVVDQADGYHLEWHKADEECCEMVFTFQQETLEDDLERLMETICDRVRWVEEKANERLWYGGLGRLGKDDR
ncbi:hypothetical protein [Brevibacillus dissolubilis]|uniref:hypothetical protein n=1 Tax=Brevibacillus dissolubilis TaxID=1844116 RepID=UPI0011176AA5|nr:hypothetical protein [Brevibacillus dissolubilis]